MVQVTVVLAAGSAQHREAALHYQLGLMQRAFQAWYTWLSLHLSKATAKQEQLLCAQVRTLSAFSQRRHVSGLYDSSVLHLVCGHLLCAVWKLLGSGAQDNTYRAQRIVCQYFAMSSFTSVSVSCGVTFHKGCAKAHTCVSSITAGSRKNPQSLIQFLTPVHAQKILLASLFTLACAVIRMPCKPISPPEFAQASTPYAPSFSASSTHFQTTSSASNSL